MSKATFIRLPSAAGKSSDLAAFLRGGRDIVASTEPKTSLWYALTREGDGGEYAIFDTFVDASGREAHFSGKVAAALRENAPALVQGGWEGGVLANVANFDVLAAKLPEGAAPAVTEATYIVMHARPGKEAALEKLLVLGRDIVASTEPKTSYWFALKAEQQPGTYAIYDLFEDGSGRDAHFAGKVAAALKEQAGELVEGGWEKGVLANVSNFRVHAGK